MNDPAGTQTWTALVALFARRRSELHARDPELYPLATPGPGASAHQLDAAEHLLGHPLDDQHRAFLSHVDGWDEFFPGVRLLGADELGRGALWEEGQETLDIFFDHGPVRDAMPPREELEPVAVGVWVPDLHVMWTKGSLATGGHPVLWLAGDEVERWPGFTEYVHAMLAHLEREISDVRDS